jgi:hypothetical protein
MRLRLSLVISISLVCSAAWASPVAPIEVTLTQADGTTFQARPRGDEYADWIETLDGYTIVEKSGEWYYATKDPGGTLVASPDKVGSLSTRALVDLPKHLSPEVDPALYEVRVPRRLREPGEKALSHTQYTLTIMVSFTDVSFTYADSSFESLVYDASGSVKDSAAV